MSLSPAGLKKLKTELSDQHNTRSVVHYLLSQQAAQGATNPLYVEALRIRDEEARFIQEAGRESTVSQADMIQEQSAIKSGIRDICQTLQNAGVIGGFTPDYEQGLAIELAHGNRSILKVWQRR